MSYEFCKHERIFAAFAGLKKMSYLCNRNRKKNNYKLCKPKSCIRFNKKYK